MKIIIVLNLYVILNSLSKRLKIYLSQCNRAIGKKYAAKYCRKELLEDIKDYLIRISKEKVVIIAKDFNQDIASAEIKANSM